MNRLFLILIVAVAFATDATSQIVINEVCSMNGGHYYDENNKSPDWIELYNNSDKSVNLKNWRIFDKNDYANAYVLPDTLMPPNSYLIVHCSGDSRVTRDNFIIRSSGYGIVDYFESDEFSYYYLPAADNFKFSVNIRALKAANVHDAAGLMFRESLTSKSAYYGIFGRIKTAFSYKFLWREEPNTKPQQLLSEYGLNYPNAYLSIAREGDTLTLAITDSTGYIIESKAIYYPAEKSLYAGIAVSATNRERYIEAVFNNLKVNGERYDFANLQFAKIGYFPDGNAYYGGEIHANFKLSSEGETVYLWNASKKLVDELSFGVIGNDYSYGRSKSDSNIKRYFDTPTPATENGEGYISVLEPPRIALKSGWYDNAQTTSISHSDPNVEIYYTIDGSDVTKANGKRYGGELISIDSSMSIRAKAFSEGYIQSKTATNSYFVKDSFNLPVVSIVAAPDDLYGSSGVFNLNNAWAKIEKKVYFEFWEDSRSPAYTSECGIQLTGSTFKIPNQKPFRLYARDRYEGDSFNYSFFADKTKFPYKKLWLRTGSTDGQGTLIRDILANLLIEDSKSVEVPNSRICVVYINGEYNGIYFLKEYIDDNYIESKYGIDRASVDLLANSGIAKEGSSRDFAELLSTIEQYDFSKEQGYLIIEQLIDINSFIDYLVLNLNTANYDWGINNVKFWKSALYDNKWRWILHDLDGAYSNSFGSSVNAFNTLYQENSAIGVLFKNFAKNQVFRDKFINRAADLMNSKLHKNLVISKVDSLFNIIEPEIDRHINKWSIPSSWGKSIDSLKDIIFNRTDHFRYHITQEFDLSGYYHIAVNDVDTAAGYTKLNSLNLMSKNWAGFYFNDVPISLSAIAYPGYSFAGWGHSSLDANKNQLIAFNENSILYPKFKVDGTATAKDPVINEIMYKASSNQDCKDWVELYNPNPFAIDISNWMLKDDKDKNAFTFSEDTQIAASGYLVIAENLSKFRAVYPAVDNVIGEFAFGLSSSEDMVRLFDDKGKLIDMVHYKSTKPWDANANGTGRTLELIDPLQDNSKAENWRASAESGGTPGRQNSVYVSIEEPISLPASLEATVYPNPASEFANIYFNSPAFDYYTIEIFNAMGEKLKHVYNGYIESGSFMISTELTSMPYGIYFINIKNSTEQKTVKFVIAN